MSIIINISKNNPLHCKDVGGYFCCYYSIIDSNRSHKVTISTLDCR